MYYKNYHSGQRGILLEKNPKNNRNMSTNEYTVRRIDKSTILMVDFNILSLKLTYQAEKKYTVMSMT